MAIKIEMLRVFRAVADCGNLAEAADQLGRTPSAVSMMLKQFEDHLGAPLFHGGRKGQLSALGELVLVEARRETDHFERTVSAIDSLARADTGLVRLAASPSIAATFLPPRPPRACSPHRPACSLPSPSCAVRRSSWRARPGQP